MASRKVTESLSTSIKNQEITLNNYDRAAVKAALEELTREKEKRLKQKQTDILGKADEKTARAVTIAVEKGAGAWLTALPLQSLGYVLNKQEFRDSVRLRYNWKKIRPSCSMCLR